MSLISFRTASSISILHCSPELRGPTPIETAILENRQETGVSLMKLTAEMDAGPVYAQRKLDLAGDETKPELAAKLLLMGAEMLIKNLPAILAGSLQPRPQDEAGQLFHDKLLKQTASSTLANRHIHWSHKSELSPAGQAAGPRYWGNDVIITKARRRSGNLDGQGAVVALKEGVLMLGYSR